MAFHWRNGTHFERQKNGDVRVFNQLADGKGEMHEIAIVVIPASEWVSIVTAVSEAGMMAENHFRATVLHMGVEGRAL